MQKGDELKAQTYLLKASNGFKPHDPRRTKIYSAALGLLENEASDDTKQASARLLKDALREFPHDDESLDRADSLVHLAHGLKDSALEAEAFVTQKSEVEWFRKHPREAEKIGYSVATLDEYLGDALLFEDKKDEAKAAFARAAEEFHKDAKKAGDVSSERGFNLERIYCLWKSGQVDEALELATNMESQFPQEFTFFYQHAKVLQDLKRKQEALAIAQKAQPYSYGDNRLRTIDLIAQLYRDLDDKKGAIKTLNDELSQFQLSEDAPPRTKRLVEKLKSFRAELEQAH